MRGASDHLNGSRSPGFIPPSDSLFSGSSGNDTHGTGSAALTVDVRLSLSRSCQKPDFARLPRRMGVAEFESRIQKVDRQWLDDRGDRALDPAPLSLDRMGSVRNIARLI